MRADDRPDDFPRWMRWVERELRRIPSGGARLKIGQDSLTFDGTGTTTLTHGFGQIPTYVSATHYTGGTNVVIAPVTGTSTDTDVDLFAQQLDGTPFVGATTVLWQVGL